MTEDERVLELDRLDKAARANLLRTTPVVFQGQSHNLPVFRVEIGFPRYRMENGRTRRKQLEFKHKNPEHANALNDPSSETAQSIQGKILEGMAGEEGLLELLRLGQNEPILLSHQGYAVNGNRRLAAMRYLHNNPSKKPDGVDFSHVDVARLPELDEKEIRRIEQRLQMSKDGKADYNWVDELLTIRENIADFGMKPVELARDMNKREKTVKKLQLMMDLIDIFLERNNKSGLYFEVEADEQAFKTLATEHQRLDGDARRQNLLLDMSFNVIQHNQGGESKHKRITKIGANLDAIVQAYEKQPGGGEETNDKPDGQPEPAIPGNPPFNEIPLEEETAERVQEAIREVDRERALADEANGPAEAVAQAAALLRGIKIRGKETKTKQLRGQLKAIREISADLLKKLDSIGPN